MSQVDDARKIAELPPIAEGEPDVLDGFHAIGVTTISAGHAIHDTYSGFLSPLLPAFIENLSLTNAQAGLLTVFMQWPSLFQPFLGYLADKVSLRPFFILAPTITAVAMSLLGVAPTYAVLAMLLLIAGISSASLHAVGPAIIGKLSGNAKLGRGMGLWMVGGELGRTLGPLTIVTAVQFLGLKGTPWLLIAGPVTSVLLYFILQDVPDITPRKGQKMEREVLKAIGAVLLPLTGVVMARSFMVASLSTYLPILLTDQGASLWLAGASLSVFEAAGVVGALLGGSLSDRLGRRRVIVASMVLAPIFMFIFLAVAGWVQFLLLIALGFTALSITPVFLALLAERFPQNRALAIGTYMAVGFLIRSAVVVLLGVLADNFGMRTAFVISAVISLAGLPLIFLLPTETGSTTGASVS